MFLCSSHLQPTLFIDLSVTFFKCGGVALGMALKHVAIDAMSAFHFFETWSAISRDGDRAAVELPFHDRTLLRAHGPRRSSTPDALSVFCPRLNFSETSAPTATETFSIWHDQLASLKRRCALVWQCTCEARRLPPDAEVRLSFPANVWRRTKPPLPDRYFGNALVWLGATGVPKHITSKTLASVAGDISSTIRKMDVELVRSAMMDYLETANTDRKPLKGSMSPTELRITSWLGMPVYDADFGWEKARVMSRAENVRGEFVCLMDAGPADGVDNCVPSACSGAWRLKI
jgi:shikimate O-hydroxycinnamoyltransferase